MDDAILLTNILYILLYILYMYLQAYRAGDHQEALVYYTRSIMFCPSAAAFNNRAITGNVFNYIVVAVLS